MAEKFKATSESAFLEELSPVNYDRVILELTVGGAGAGLDATVERRLRVGTEAESQLPFERLDIVVNGSVVWSAPAAGRQEKC